VVLADPAILLPNGPLTHIFPKPLHHGLSVPFQNGDRILGVL
jgi:hypothetical protein